MRSTGFEQEKQSDAKERLFDHVYWLFQALRCFYRVVRSSAGNTSVRTPCDKFLCLRETRVAYACT